ncbi:MAG: HAMP domain-containing histidine kinase [Myxococcales bacterium]|nr:MAG: HAMP domain-containing histidine kinase [Myxococcales bacterium]
MAVTYYCAKKGYSVVFFIRLWTKKLYEGLQWSFKESEPYFATFGISVLVGVLGFYFINPVVNSDVYENIGLRIVGGILVTPLMFTQFWPLKLKKYLFIYWYLVFIYVLPFFFTFMILMNPLSNIWHLNGLICLIIMVLFVDLGSLLLLLFIGISAGFICFYVRLNGKVIVPEQLLWVLFCYLGPICYVVLFSRKREKIQQLKINNMKFVAESIAHELRTPLSSMTMAAQALGQLLPTFCHAYTLAKEAKLPVKTIAPFLQKNLEELPCVLDTVSRNANAMVTLLLANLREETKFEKLQQCSMIACIQSALSTYPFSKKERLLVNWDINQQHNDFDFIGHSELMKHVFFNLLKNALYAIAQAKKGDITISIIPASRDSEKKSGEYNKVIFMDTATGIAPNIIPHIFDRFYSNKEHGTGIGLAFCRTTLHAFNGHISCSSQQGKHTSFTLYLPLS